MSLITFRQDIFTQYRLIKYIKDILNNWLADPANIQDLRLSMLLYKNGKLRKDCIKTGLAYNSLDLFTGLTPNITISLGSVQYLKRSINFLGNYNFAFNKMSAPTANVQYKTIPIKVTITALGYLSTIVITLLILLFLAANINLIQSDCTMLDSTSIAGVSLPVPVKPGLMANAKLLYKSLITLLAHGHVMWATNTQGPVFQGITINKQ